MDKLIPIKTIDEEKEQLIEQLEREDFGIKNFENCSVVGTIIMIFLRIKIEISILIRKIYMGMFVKYANEEWLDNKAEDYGKYRKQATKTEGYLTIQKIDKEKELIIPKGYVFKTLSSLAGKEYRFISAEKTVIKANEETGKILIIAEETGSKYNVVANSIRQSLVHIENIKYLSNEEDWIIKEGSDIEIDESFRKRTLNTWSELATYSTALKYKNVAESVEGVLYVIVNDMHPRGQGTVDIVVASYNGTAGEKLLKDVGEAIESIKGVYDNVLVKSAETVSIDINLILYIDYSASEEGLKERAITYVKEYFEISNKRELNTLYLSELIFYVRKNLDDEITAIKILEPSTDVKLEKHKIIILNRVNVSIERV
ncbi:baseplate J/gp47 family protein [[Clostridium] colinum]|uniref:baseplate J/gp47 family protein n=1 Tax=[Clostridium] colinum TaxID=36835 RepID=UPI002024B995|nr:baseplate J/gp47 family protein [[Clostridium] colinum]